MNLDLPGWAWGAATFVALQILALSLGILGNLYTPIFRSQLSAIGSGFTKWRTFEITYSTYRILAYNKSPHFALARMMFYIFFSLTFSIQATALIIMYKIPGENNDKGPLIDLISAENPTLGMAVAGIAMLMTLYLVLRVIREYSALLHPGKEIRAQRRRAAKIGASWQEILVQAQAWLDEDSVQVSDNIGS